MKVGDLVINMHPDSGFYDKIGIVLEVLRDPDGYELLNVQYENNIFLWIGTDCEVIDESR